jgi:hypothetical protein
MKMDVETFEANVLKGAYKFEAQSLMTFPSKQSIEITLYPSAAIVTENIPTLAPRSRKTAFGNIFI